jgi:hypothetical protein
MNDNLTVDAARIEGIPDRVRKRVDIRAVSESDHQGFGTADVALGTAVLFEAAQRRNWCWRP